MTSPQVPRDVELKIVSLVEEMLHRRADGQMLVASSGRWAREAFRHPTFNRPFIVLYLHRSESQDGFSPGITFAIQAAISLGSPTSIRDAPLSTYDGWYLAIGNLGQLERLNTVSRIDPWPYLQRRDNPTLKRRVLNLDDPEVTDSDIAKMTNKLANALARAYDAVEPKAAEVAWRLDSFEAMNDINHLIAWRHVAGFLDEEFGISDAGISVANWASSLNEPRMAASALSLLGPVIHEGGGEDAWRNCLITAGFSPV